MELANKTRLLGLSRVELEGMAEEFGQPTYRGRQIFDAIYRQRIGRLEAISTLPAGLRAEFAERGIAVGELSVEKKFESSDGTIRYLMGLEDGESVETVWMPEGDEGETGDGSAAPMR